MSESRGLSDESLEPGSLEWRDRDNKHVNLDAKQAPQPLYDLKNHPILAVRSIDFKSLDLNKFCEEKKLDQPALLSEAKKGDPICNALYGVFKSKETNSFNKARAYAYFEDALKNADHHLAYAIAEYVANHMQAPADDKGQYQQRIWRYYRLAIGKGSVKAAEKLRNWTVTKEKKEALAHGWVEVSAYDNDTYTNWKWVPRRFNEKFVNLENPAFRSVCTQCSHEKVKAAFKHCKEEDGEHYVQGQIDVVQQELVDRIIIAHEQSNKRKAIDSIKTELSSEYHEEYFNDLQNKVNKRYQDIDVCANILLDELRKKIVAESRELLKSIRGEREEKTEVEDKFKNCFTQSEVVKWGKVEEKSNETLQVRLVALKNICNALEIQTSELMVVSGSPPPKPYYASIITRQSDRKESEEEVKPGVPLQKLRQVWEAIIRVQTGINKRMDSPDNSYRWKNFSADLGFSLLFCSGGAVVGMVGMLIKFAASGTMETTGAAFQIFAVGPLLGAGLVIAGILMMACYTKYTYGTYNFFKSDEQLEQTWLARNTKHAIQAARDSVNMLVKDDLDAIARLPGVTVRAGG